MMRLQGRTALVSGAGGPMGRTVAELFAREGASLVLTDISARRLADSVAVITPLLRTGAKMIGQRADVTQAGEAAAVVPAGRAAIGYVDIVVNIVGGIKAKALFEPMVTMTEERWDATFALNRSGLVSRPTSPTPAFFGERRGILHHG